MAVSESDEGVEPGEGLDVPKPQMPSVSDIFAPSSWKLWSWFTVVLVNVALSVVRIISLTFEEGVEKYLN